MTTIRTARFFRADLDHEKHGYRPVDQETDEIAEEGKDVDDGRSKSGYGAEYGKEIRHCHVKCPNLDLVISV